MKSILKVKKTPGNKTIIGSLDFALGKGYRVRHRVCVEARGFGSRVFNLCETLFTAELRSSFFHRSQLCVC